MAFSLLPSSLAFSLPPLSVARSLPPSSVALEIADFWAGDSGGLVVVVVVFFLVGTVGAVDVVVSDVIVDDVVAGAVEDVVDVVVEGAVASVVESASERAALYETPRSPGAETVLGRERDSPPLTARAGSKAGVRNRTARNTRGNFRTNPFDIGETRLLSLPCGAGQIPAIQRTKRRYRNTTTGIGEVGGSGSIRLWPAPRQRQSQTARPLKRPGYLAFLDRLASLFIGMPQTGKSTTRDCVIRQRRRCDPGPRLCQRRELLLCPSPESPRYGCRLSIHRT